MGLDMYLREEVYIGAYHAHRGIVGSINLKKKLVQPKGNKKYKKLVFL